MKGTLALSWGPPCRPYVYRNGHCWRIVAGPVALTYVPDVEIEDLMRVYVDHGELRDLSAGLGVGLRVLMKAYLEPAARTDSEAADILVEVREDLGRWEALGLAPKYQGFHAVAHLSPIRSEPS